MSELTVVIIVFLGGLLAMLIEMFLPGVIIGTTGFLAVVGSIIYAFATGHRVAGGVLVVVSLALVPAFFILWKSVMVKLFGHKGAEEDFQPSTTVSADLVGVEGVALTALHPAGIARLAGKRRDVVTRGEMVDKGAKVKVIEVSGNRVVVKQVGE